jgi:hypothetical protein
LAARIDDRVYLRANKTIRHHPSMSTLAAEMAKKTQRRLSHEQQTGHGKRRHGRHGRLEEKENSVSQCTFAYTCSRMV